MTEPENFDDDLFADLYNDDEPSAKPVASAEKAVPPSLPAATPNDVYDGMDHAQDYGAPTDSHQNEEYDEDDDDVDFNLGNGNTAHQADTPSYNNNSAPAPAPVARGPNSKEDG